MHDQSEHPSTIMIPERKFDNRNKGIKIALVFVFFIIAIILLYNFDLSELRGFIDQNRDLTLLISFLAIFLTSLTFIPTAPTTVFVSLLIGPLPAIAITTLGNTFSAIVHYQIGKQIGDVVNFEEKKASLPFKLGKLPANSPLFLLIGRGIPGGPRGLSFVCGAYRVQHFRYLWTTFVTNFLGAALIAYGGAELTKLL